MIKKPLKLNKKSILITGIIILLLVAIALTLVFTLNKDEDIIKTTFDINSIEITLDGEEAQAITKDFTAEPFTLSVILNENNIDFEKYLEPTINWQIIGDSLNCTIDENGEFTIGDTLGTVTVQVKVTSKNEINKSITIRINPKTDWLLQSIDVTPINISDHKVYIEGEQFNDKSIVVTANFGEIQAKLSEYSINKTILEIDDDHVIISSEINGVIKDFQYTVSVAEKTLQYIKIDTLPNKTIYKEGELFVKDGIIVKACYEFKEVVLVNYIVDEITPLTLNEDVFVFYTENAKTVNCAVPVTILPKELLRIELSLSNVKRVYTQGEIFDKKHLIVTAFFDNGENAEVLDYSIDKDTALFASDNEIIVSYIHRSTTKSQSFEITVILPYSNIRQIKIVNPEDIRLSWAYEYIDNDGEFKKDNTKYEENGLLFDVVNGIYSVPVGAKITLTTLNPAVVAVIIDGQEINESNIVYEIKLFEPKKEDDVDEGISIDTINLAGDRLTIRFSGQSELIFVYPKTWDAALRIEDLLNLSNRFQDNESMYYEYIVDEIHYTFSEISNYTFNSNKVVIVERKENEKESAVITLMYYDEYAIDIVVDMQNINPAEFPIINRVGYIFDGWDEVTNKTYVAQWIEENVSYTSNELVGTWQFNYEGILFEIVFNADGLYSYIVNFDSEIITRYNGVYRINEETICLLSVETDDEYNILVPDDFGLSFEDSKLNVKLFIQNGLSIWSNETTVEFTKHP